MTTPIPARPREAELLAAATRLFRQRGYHATSMQDLGEALGMNRGSLYHYINGKDELQVDRLLRPGLRRCSQGRQGAHKRRPSLHACLRRRGKA